MSPGLNDPNWMMVACAVPQSTLADRPIKPELDKGAHSEDAVERGGLVAWQPPHVRDEDLVPLTVGESPRHLMGSHRDSAQTPGPNPSSGHGPAVDGGAVDAQADKDAQELVVVDDLAVLVGVAWALRAETM
jgi:hypothetical protein